VGKKAHNGRMASPPSTTSVAKQSEVSAYTDESGNTGLNLFDRSQPDFFTMTLVAKDDLNVLAAGPVTRWCQLLKVERLHAAELGVGRLSLVATEILNFLMDARLLFVVTKVNKRHVAAMKFVDTVLDNGTNGAVDFFHYASRPMRLRLAMDLEGHLTPRNQREFWEAYRTRDFASFREVVYSLETRISIDEPDRRIRQLLCDALSWARAHPDAVLDKRSEADSPNVVAFSLLMHAVHSMLEGTGLRVGKFVHDQQNEFMASFRWIYDVLSRLRLRDQGPAMIPRPVESGSFDCPLTEEASGDSPALQLVDVLLWLLKRFLRDGTTGNDGCDKVLGPILVVGAISSFTRETLAEEVEQLTARIAQMPLTSAQLKKGRAFQERVERVRLKKMREDT
jgi:hypothetical protein